jgi:hypothetical protein
MPAWATRQDPISETKAQGGTAVHSCNSSHVSETPSQKQKKSQSRIRGIPQWSDCLGRSSPSFYPSAKKKKKNHTAKATFAHISSLAPCRPLTVWEAEWPWLWPEALQGLCVAFFFWPQTSILLISASQIPRITGVSHRAWVVGCFWYRVSTPPPCLLVSNSQSLWSSHLPFLSSWDYRRS